MVAVAWGRTVARCPSQITRPAFVALRLCHLLRDAFGALMVVSFPRAYAERQMAHERITARQTEPTRTMRRAPAERRDGATTDVAAVRGL